MNDTLNLIFDIFAVTFVSLFQAPATDRRQKAFIANFQQSKLQAIELKIPSYMFYKFHMIMYSEPAKQKDERFIVHYSLGFKKVCLITVFLPFMALVICFTTAYIFQYNDIQETHCRVFNIIPSISAITGISPQRYIWRISVAFHVGPRLITSAVYRAYHLTLIDQFAQQEIQFKAQLWLNTAFWLNVIETGALCGVTYISNRENYAVHEKLFIIFMISSLTHMLACIKAMKAIMEMRKNTCDIQRKVGIKQALLVVSIWSTVGLIGFFLQHRLLCHRMEKVRTIPGPR